MINAKEARKIVDISNSEVILDGESLMDIIDEKIKIAAKNGKSRILVHLGYCPTSVSVSTKLTPAYTNVATKLKDLGFNVFFERIGYTFWENFGYGREVTSFGFVINW